MPTCTPELCEGAYVTHTNTQQICYMRTAVCVQVYAYVTCGQVSVKRSYDVYEPYTYVTPVHYTKSKSLFRERLL